MRKFRMMLGGLLTVALLVPIGGAASSAPSSYKLQPWAFGEAEGNWESKEGEQDARGDARFALYLAKNVSTAENAAAGADLFGLNGEPFSALNGLAFDRRRDGYCGAGAPRFNVFYQEPDGDIRAIFVGCQAMTIATAAEPLNWERRTCNAACLSLIAAQQGANTTGATIYYLQIVFDEGPAETWLDNITVNDHTWTSPSDNGNGH